MPLHAERSGSLQTTSFSNDPYSSPVEPPAGSESPAEVEVPHWPIANDYDSRPLLEEGERLLTAIEVALRESFTIFHRSAVRSSDSSQALR
jgi:hypothetical protein